MTLLDPERVVMTTAEPAYCPSCELKHTRRPDWLCPRCRMPVERNAPERRSRRAPRRELGFPLGSRIGGAVLGLASAALAFGFAKDPATEHRWPLLAAALILAVLALPLLLRRPAARWLAIAAVVVAAALVSEDLIRQRLPDLIRDPLPELIRGPVRAVLRAPQPRTILLFLGFATGSLLLLAGRPRRVRIAAGVLLAAPLIALEIVGAFGR